MSIWKNHQLRVAWRWFWRLLWFGLLLMILVWVFEKQIASWYGGRWQHRPEEVSRLSDAARKLIHQAADGLQRGQLFDYGVHVLPTDSDEALPSWAEPRRRMRVRAWRSAAAVDQDKPLKVAAANAYFDRLLRLQRGHVLSPVMLVHANQHAAQAVSWPMVQHGQAHYPGVVVAAASVSPLADDVAEQMATLKKEGVRYLYLDASAPDLGPIDERYTAFIAALKKNKLILVVQLGPKRSDVPAPTQMPAVNLDPDQLTPILSAGVRVIVAGVSQRQWLSASRRMGAIGTIEKLTELVKQHPQQLYLDIGGLIYQDFTALELLLQRIDLHRNLVYSSQYPAPAFARGLRLEELASAGFVPPEMVPALTEIYNYNPLLMDFVVKRLLKLPHTRGDDQVRFPIETFMAIDQRPKPKPPEAPKKPEKHDK